MRCIDRDRREVRYRHYHGLERVVDAQGRLTGENRPVYGPVHAIRPTVSPVSGSATGDVYGMSTEGLDVVMTLDDPTVAIWVGDPLWLNNEEPEDNDFVVRRVAKTARFTVIGARFREGGGEEL